jgi:hypothetical protein
LMLDRGWRRWESAQDAKIKTIKLKRRPLR